MKRFFNLSLIAMLAFLNMNARVTLGNVQLNNVSEFEINESITEMSNVARLVVPRNFALRNDVALLQQFKVGDRVTIECGYNGEYHTEFTGYVAEIDSDIPLVIRCDDMFMLRQNNFVLSYPAGTTLRLILNDIVPSDIIVECDDMIIGKYLIDNASTFAVLQDLASNFMLYSRLNDNVLRIGLAFSFGENTQRHTYRIGGNVKSNDLKFKRAEDVKIRFNAIATNPDGTRTTVSVGAQGNNVSERTLNFVGPKTEDDLRKYATAALAKVSFDGYQGSITGFGIPRTRAGDSLTVIDRLEPDNDYREGTYLIEATNVIYGRGGFSRQNNLSYKI